MADLIERLRTRVRGGQDGTRLEAAREIERLRAQVEELSDAFTVLWVTANRDEWDGKAVEKFDDILERNGGGEILLLPANVKVTGAPATDD